MNKKKAFFGKGFRNGDPWPRFPSLPPGRAAGEPCSLLRATGAASGPAAWAWSCVSGEFFVEKGRPPKVKALSRICSRN